MPFRLVSPHRPCGDQPQAIERIEEGLRRGDKHQVLLGITGSGKTFTVACAVERVQRPTLLIAHNKTLAAQLFAEFKELFPDNAVHFFVSYYDYYQPEAYVPASDTYIEKDSIINDDIDRLRHAATYALLSRRDVIIVASVSCIFGIGSAEAYSGMLVQLHRGQSIDRDDLLRALVDAQYDRNDYDFHRGTFRVRGDVVEIFPAHEQERAVRVEFFGDEIEGLYEVDPLRGKVIEPRDHAVIMPSSHYVTPEEHRRRAICAIREELAERLEELNREMCLVEAQRLEQRTMFDLEMLEQMGFCTGIENYSRHLSGRAAGEPPPTLLDYFPSDMLVVIDESHQTIPQLRAMYRGDRSRKETLVQYGFRLPSALDNRPLRFEEFFERVEQVVYVSATPGDFELEQTQGVIVEQILRPTGLLDPEVEVRPVSGQIDDLLEEIRLRVARGDRVLVTTLTKRMAEDLTEYFEDLGVRVRYLHSDIDTLERVQIIRDLRSGVFDVLVGINLLREGLDLPEVSLVAILDADKEGFLRSTRALIQTIGRASRNTAGKAIMYADTLTESIRNAVAETERRRRLQAAYNAQHGITPRTVQRRIADHLSESIVKAAAPAGEASDHDVVPLEQIPEKILALREEMHRAAAELAFERAAELRDRIGQLSDRELLLRDATARVEGRSPTTSARSISTAHEAPPRARGRRKRRPAASRPRSGRGR